ncbi:MAG: pantetheine-phosphate adenylyltransferase [Anaerolineaceae bacterium]|nr:pantetheine-phosphate adenylyltransferase [Anaerolineaceae bacterium]
MAKVVFPGSFDPIHLGHIDIARRASQIFDEVVVAVYDRPSKNLLFSPSERIRMVKECLKPYKNIKVTGYSGLTINFAREINAKAIVRGLRVFSDYEYEFRMALANHRLQKEIDTIAFITAEENTFISSSTVKEIASLGGDVSSMVPPLVVKALDGKYNLKDAVSI